VLDCSRVAAAGYRASRSPPVARAQLWVQTAPCQHVPCLACKRPHATTPLLPSASRFLSCSGELPVDAAVSMCARYRCQHADQLQPTSSNTLVCCQAGCVTSCCCCQHRRGAVPGTRPLSTAAAAVWQTACMVPSLAVHMLPSLAGPTAAAASASCRLHRRRAQDAAVLQRCSRCLRTVCGPLALAPLYQSPLPSYPLLYVHRRVWPNTAKGVLLRCLLRTGGQLS
jgi:hypothetical protein